MNIKGNNYELSYEYGLLRISGKLSLMIEEYSALDDFFKTIIDTKPSSLILDIRTLEYLNSSGIKTLCVGLILEAAAIEGHRLKILCSNKFTWQKETVPTFIDLMEGMEIIFC